MPSYTDFTGLGGIAVALAALAVSLAPRARMSGGQRMLLFAGVALASLLPHGGLPLAAYVRGASGDLSLTTLTLLLLGVFGAGAGFPAASGRERLALQLGILLASLALYPLALGLGMFDPYRLGYGHPGFMAGLLLLALASWFWRFYLPALCLALAVLAWRVGWYESGNLWDYLLDPLLAVYAGGALLRRGVAALRGHGQTRQTQ